MGRHDVRSLRVHEAASLLLNVRRNAPTPPWYQVMTEFPPSAALVRAQPVQHRERAAKLKKYKKPSKMFMPQSLAYPEDKLRTDFFADHPWELARPRILNEDDGKDGQRWDWSKEHEPGRPLNGESVVQRQQWLMTVGPTATDPQTDKPVRKPLSRAAAYDVARKEFYDRRHYDEVELRVQREEAQAVDARFGMTASQVGMQLEGEAFDEWKAWANEQVVKTDQSRAAAYTGNPVAGRNRRDGEAADIVDDLLEDTPAADGAGDDAAKAPS